jgi:hypothetical protein
VKVNYRTLLAGAALVLLSAAGARAEGPAASALATDANATPGPTAVMASTASTAPVGRYYAGDTATYDDGYDPVADFVARAGAWGVHSTGSQTQTGKYQNLDSSPESDFSGIWSNGERTLDFELQTNDNETQNGRVHYYGPHVEADLNFEQFQNQLSEHNFAGFNFNGQNNTPGPSYAVGAGNPQTPKNTVIFTDNNLSPGLDSAITIQEFKANFKGNITENLKWRLNVFGIDKEGVRQVSEFQHCSAAAGNGSGPNLPTPLPVGGTPVPTNDTNLTSQCHVTTQAQHIDWQTTEITPTLELRLDCNTFLEYSHMIRTFTANDQNVTFNYDTAVAGYSPNSAAVTAATSSALSPAARQAAINNLTAGYAIVPDSQTQIDRLKFSTKIGCNTDVYMLGYAGYNEDELRDTYRDFQGGDLRITNKSLEHMTSTVYGKYYNETTTNPTFALSPSPAPANNFYQEPNLSYFTPPTTASPSNIGPQIDRQVSGFGFDERWRPFEDQYGSFAARLSILAGYEYSSLKRENAEYVLSQQPGLNGQFVSNGVFKQPDTDKSTVTLGLEEKWSSTFNTFLRYKYIDTAYPLYGVTNQVSYSIAYALDTNQPTQENRVETGFTWTPTDCLMVNATLYVENAYCNAPYVTPWTSNSLPFTVSTWWAPTQAWSFSAGFSEMDSWINQEVNLGQINQAAVQNTAVKVPWNYQGVADVFTLGTRFAATEKLTFTGEFEYVRADDLNGATVTPSQQVPTTAPLPPGAPVNYTLGQYSNVQTQSFRFAVGADYLLRPRVTTYVRYNYYDFQDASGITSGQVSMLLGGMSAKF